MAGSSFGTILKVTTFGESHGPALGAVLDGFPAGMELSEADIQPYLDRRSPGRSPIATQRREPDKVRILSGVFEGKTTGTPIALLIENTSQHSQDYAALKDLYRPGHADYGFETKFGFRDYRGGGRSSGRETCTRVAAGAVAEIFLKRVLGIDFICWTSSIGPVKTDLKPDDPGFDRERILTSPTRMPDAAAEERALAFMEQCRAEQDSAGGTVSCCIRGVPAGLGDPAFGKLDAELSGALMSIGAVKAVEIGDGIGVAARKGSENNDAFRMDPATGKVIKKTNHAGGILGGISDGSDLLVRLSLKPTPSIAREQETVTEYGENTTVSIHGRHDPVIVPRAVVVAETTIAFVLLDKLLLNMSARTDRIRDFYHTAGPEEQ